jgi:hypothetical protein
MSMQSLTGIPKNAGEPIHMRRMSMFLSRLRLSVAQMKSYSGIVQANRFNRTAAKCVAESADCAIRPCSEEYHEDTFY